MRSTLRKPIFLIFSLIVFHLSSVMMSYAASAQFIYDSLNRLIQIRYSDGTAITYSYDQAGNRIAENIQVILPITKASWLTRGKPLEAVRPRKI